MNSLQKEAARERLAKARAIRAANLAKVADERNGVVASAEVRSPEVQAVIDTMDPTRKARLAMAQGRVWATEEGQRALARREEEKRGIAEQTIQNSQAVLQNPPVRLGSREVSLIVRTDGLVVSQNGPCVCGRPKREWHAICLKENSNG